MGVNGDSVSDKETDNTDSIYQEGGGSLTETQCTCNSFRRTK